MNIVHTLHVAEDIKNEAQLINAFLLIEQDAKEKNLMIIVAGDQFNFMERGKPCGKDPVFKAKNLDGARQFIDGLK